jgi:hypothetical protein
MSDDETQNRLDRPVDHTVDHDRAPIAHRPVSNSELARRAAELVEMAPDNTSFWDAHVHGLFLGARCVRSSLLRTD